jgi:hypothetical protein
MKVNYLFKKLTITADTQIVSFLLLNNNALRKNTGPPIRVAVMAYRS